MPVVEVSKINSAIGCWKTLFEFFKSDPMIVIMSLITIIGFVITIYLLIKIMLLNSTYKKRRKINNYLEKYEGFKKRLIQKNIPEDIYKQVENTNIQLYSNIGFCLKLKISNQFKTVKNDDSEHSSLKSFIDDTKINLDKELI
jgi:hypothetical protein